MNENKPNMPKLGQRFLHSRVYDATQMPAKVPQMYEVSSMRYGCIYYRPVYRYEPTGRIAVGKPHDYILKENWAKIWLRNATPEEAMYGKIRKEETQ